MSNFNFPAGAPTLSTVSVHKQFPLLTEYSGTNGAKYLYVRSVGAAIPVANAVGVNPDGEAASLTQALANAGNIVGAAIVAIPNGSYGWVQTQGAVEIQTGTGVNDGVQLFTTGTAGRLDDAVSTNTPLYGVRVIDDAPSGNVPRLCFIAGRILAGVPGT